TEAVAFIAAYDVVPLALPHSYVAGVGLYKRGVVVSLRLNEIQQSGERRAVTGAVLAPPRPQRSGRVATQLRGSRPEGLRGADSALRWAVEISRVVAFASVRVRVPQRQNPWFFAATTDDGRTLPWLDVERMVSDLGGTPPAVEALGVDIGNDVDVHA